MNEPAISSPAGQPPLPDKLIDAAIAWSVKLHFNTPSASTQAAFERWLQADPLHARAWQRVTAAREPFAAMPAGLLRDTMTNLRGRQRQTRRNVLKLLALAGFACGSGWLIRTSAPWQRLIADASTATGEIRTLTLQDGTQITLNTDSAISTRMLGELRLIVLRRGEVLITTGADAGMAHRRPFWVHTPFGRLQALGTRFTVRLEETRARISVQEGAVALHPAGNATTDIVHSGETRWLTADASAPATLAGIEADSWADGIIAGRNMRLADLLAELARYRLGRIVCDAGVADLRVSGLYHVDDTDRTLAFLAQTQPIVVSYRTRFFVHVGPRDTSR